MTALEWITKYDEHLTLTKGRALNTVRAYRVDLELMQRFFNLADWKDFTEENATEYLRHLKSSYTDSGMARKIYVYRGFFKFLRKRNVITLDPWEEVEPKRYDRKLPVVLTVQEMNRLLSTIRVEVRALAGVPNEETFLTFRDRAILETLYAGALRVSEVCNLNWDDIDFAKRELRVLHGKGNKHRLVPLGQYAIDALLKYRPHFEEKWKRKAEGQTAVFLSMRDRRILTRSIPRVINRWVTRAGIKKHIHPHVFRHSAATHLLENGMDIRVIQQLLGHASIMTTEIYAKVGTRKLKSEYANAHPRA